MLLNIILDPLGGTKMLLCWNLISFPTMPTTGKKGAIKHNTQLLIIPTDSLATLCEWNPSHLRTYSFIIHFMKATCGGHPFLFLPFQSPTSPPQKKDSSKRRTRMLNIPIDPLGETLLWKPPHLWTYSFNESQLWGVPFPSPKKLDFEGFYIKNFTEKKTYSSFWKYGCVQIWFLSLSFPNMSTTEKDSDKRRTRMLNIPIDPLGETLVWKPSHLWTYSFNESQLWGVPFPSPRKLDFEAFYIKNFKEKKTIRFFWTKGCVQTKDSTKRRTRMPNIPIDPLGETLLRNPWHLCTYSLGGIKHSTQQLIMPFGFL